MTDEPELPPLVVRVEPVAAAPPPPPQPGFLLAALLTFGYWVCLIGGMLAVVIVAVIVLTVADGKAAAPAPDAGGSDVSRMPPAIRAALAWSFPAGYLFGLVYTVIVLRVVVGRRWFRDIGLTRLPPYHLLLGVLALPGFILLSDALARLVHPVDGFVQQVTGIRDLGDMSESLRAIFENLHWSVAVLAIGIGPGLVEELWCRGFLGRGFIGRYGWFAGIGLSSAFFGMLHLWPPSYVIVTAAMGACLHVAYITSRSLWVPIAMHFANNSSAALAVMNIVPAAEIEAGAAKNPEAVTALAAVVLLTCGLAMWQARWTWPGERRGMSIPPVESEARLQSATPKIFYFAPAIASCGALIRLLAG